MSHSPLLAPFTIGLQHNRAPWQCAPQSFQQLHNARIHYGYVTSPQAVILRAQIPSKLPITGILRYTQSVGEYQTLIWDTENLYIKNESPFFFKAINTTPLFKQSFSFIQVTEMTTQKQGHTLFFTSGKEGLWTYNPKSSTVLHPYPLTQSSSSQTVEVVNAKMILSVAGRLLLFGVTEKVDGIPVTFDYRVRWSAAGDPLNLLDGGYADAATAEDLIGIESLQNSVIVTFTNGLWILESTLNSQRPFLWRKIDSNVRCFSRNSLIPYPLEVHIIGERGYMTTDGRQVQRIDEAIPLFIEQNMDYSEASTFFGFRDYTTQTSWYLFKDTEKNQKSLIYDEISKSFSTYDVPFTVLGTGTSNINYAFKDFSLENNMYWTLSSQYGKRLCDYHLAGEEKVYGGDSQGHFYELTKGMEDLPTSSFSKKSVLETASWNPFIEQGCQSRLLYLDVFVEGNASQTLEISFFKDEDIYPYLERKIDLLPHLGFVGDITFITNHNKVITINCPDHGLLEDTLITCYGILGMTALNNIANLSVTPTTPDHLVVNNFSLPINQKYLGGGKVYLRPFTSKKNWKRILAGGTGFLHRVRMVFEGEGGTQFKLHALKPKFIARSRRLI